MRSRDAPLNVHAAIVDQRLTGILEQNPDWFPWRDENKRRSAAFVLLCMSTSLGLPLEECADLLTEGGNDAGVDGLHMSDIHSEDFTVTLFQGKYKVKDLGGEANFPENGLRAAIQSAEVLFDPQRHIAMNPQLAPRIEEIRSLINDGHIPNVRFILCSNGAKWHVQADRWVQQAEQSYGEQLQLVHYNHANIVQTLSRGPRVDTVLMLTGDMATEDLNYTRTIVGRLSVHEVHRLFKEHGDQLLERNIRRYLGGGNRVNADIRETLRDPERAANFYLYNNGITATCESLAYSTLQKANHRVQVGGLQIVNGGQTCKTIHETLAENSLCADDAYVLIRLHQLPPESTEVVREITRTTNSQTPVDLRDLRSNDEVQKALALGMEQLGYSYWRHDRQGRPGKDDFTSATIAEAVLAIWRGRPQQAKFLRRDHFGRLYGLIFDGLNPAQALVAALIFREVERRRREAEPPATPEEPFFTPYASHHIAMLIGRALCAEHQIDAADISHRNFKDLRTVLAESADRHYALAEESIVAALRHCYGDRPISLQQLSATFRRGDLLEMLNA